MLQVTVQDCRHQTTRPANPCCQLLLLVAVRQRQPPQPRGWPQRLRLQQQEQVVLALVLCWSPPAPQQQPLQPLLIQQPHLLQYSCGAA
jgi:hypothetical protein